MQPEGSDRKQDKSSSSTNRSQKNVIQVTKSQISKQQVEIIQKRVDQQQKFPTLINLPQTQQNFPTIETNVELIKEKLANFTQLMSFQKTTYIKDLVNILKQLKESGLHLLPKLFSDIMADLLMIKKALLSEIPILIRYLSQQEQSIPKLKQFIAPLIIKFIQQPQLQIKEQAANCLAILAGCLDQESRGECILTHILSLAHDDTNEQNRIVAVQLFAEMASLFGKDLCQQFIGFQFQSLGQDVNLKVRKQAIIHLPSIARVVGSRFFKNKTFQFYQDKLKQTNWALRKASIQIIDEISQLCDDEIKNSGILDQIVFQYLKDTNKYIKAATYKKLGAYIHSLKGREINPKLVQAYNKMATSELDAISNDNDILYSCAYNFPAVLDALGSAKWSQLTPTYSKLLKIPDKKIKRSLASSLHELSRILGQKRTKQHLFAVLDKFIKDPRDQIKVQAIKNLGNVLKILNQQKREELVDVFVILQNDQKKWRIRECIATQIATLTQIFSITTVFTYLVPIAFKLCSDIVFCVREQAAAQIGDIYKKFRSQQGKIYLPAIIQNIKGFSNSSKYTQRQTYITICRGLIKQQQFFKQTLFPLLKVLLLDKILNVRISLARFISQNIDLKNKIQEFEELKEILMKDECEDVRYCFEDQ